MRKTLVAVLFGIAVPTTAAAQSPAACSGSEFHQFDYWVGSWTVKNTDGELQGHNRVESISGGCAILENWTSEGGPPGKSVNFYDPETGKWNQVWVGGGGLILRLEGGLTPEGSMRLVGGERPARQGARVRDRITWIPNPDGSVVQVWEIQPAGRDDWQEIFRGVYRK